MFNGAGVLEGAPGVCSIFLTRWSVRTITNAIRTAAIVIMRIELRFFLNIIRRNFRKRKLLPGTYGCQIFERTKHWQAMDKEWT